MRSASPRVVRIFCDLDQPAALQASNDAAPGGSFDLFGGGEFLQRLRPAKDQHRQRGEASRAFAGGSVLLTHVAEKVNRGRVQAIGDGDGFRRSASGVRPCIVRRKVSALFFG